MTQFIQDQDQKIPVEIVEETKGQPAVKIRAIEGYPFALSHGTGLSIKHPSDPDLRLYNTTWVNACEIKEES